MPFITLNPETDIAEFRPLDKYDRNNPIITNQIAAEPINYFINTFKYPEILKALAHAFNYWIQAPEEKFIQTHEIVKIKTVGSLLIQDFQYNKESRQGKPTAHHVYSLARVISATTFSGLVSLMLGNEYLHRAEEVVTKHVVNRCRIVKLQLEARDNDISPTEELYYKMCGSTGMLMLLQMEIELLQELFGTNKKINLVNLANNIRMFLTIVDECKRVAEDNTEDIEIGHLTFPVVYVLNKAGDDGEILLQMMRQRSKDQEVLKYALSLVKNSNCFEYARKKLESLKDEILQECKALGKNPRMEEFFQEYLQIPKNFKQVNWGLY